MKLTTLLFIFLSTFILKAQLPNYIPILVGDKYGFCDSNKKMLVEPEFDLVYLGANGYWVEKGDKTFLMDPNSGIKTNVYDDIQGGYNTTYGLYSSNRNERWYTQFNQRVDYLMAGTRNDTIFYFYGVPDTVVFFIINEVNGQKVGFYDSLYKWVATSTPLNSQWTRLKTDIYTRKGKIYSTKNTTRFLGDNYFVECDKKGCGIIKIEEDSVEKLTSLIYDHIFYNEKSNNFKVLKRAWRQVVKKEYRYDSTGFVNDYGAEIANFKWLSRVSKEFLMFGTNRFDGDLNIDSNVLTSGHPNYHIWLRDSVTGKWPPPLYTDNTAVAAGKNYVVKLFEHSNEKPNYKYGLINNAGKTIMPFKYNYMVHYPDLFVYFTDSISTGLATESGEILYQEFSDSTRVAGVVPIVDKKWVRKDVVLYRSTDTIRYQEFYKFENNSLIPLDTSIVNAYFNSLYPQPIT